MSILAYSQPVTDPFPRRKLWLAASLGTFLLSANTIILAIMLPSAAFHDRLPSILAIPGYFLLFPPVAIALPLAGSALLRNAIRQREAPLLACLIMAILSLVSSGFMAREILRMSGLTLEFLFFGTVPGLVAAASFLLIVLILSLLSSPQQINAPFEPREFAFSRFLEEVCFHAAGVALFGFTLACIIPQLRELNQEYHLLRIPLLQTLLYAFNTLAGSGILIPLLLTLSSAIPFFRLLRRRHGRLNPPPARGIRIRTLLIYFAGAMIGTILTFIIPPVLAILLTGPKYPK